MLPNSDDGSASEMSVLALIDAIATYLSESVLGRFGPDPHGSFVVDAGVTGDVLACLRVALNAGAIVHVRQSSSKTVLTSLTNERFRLAYLLAPRREHEFMLRLGRPVPLSRILGSRAERHVSAPLPWPNTSAIESDQLSLDLTAEDHR